MVNEQVKEKWRRKLKHYIDEVELKLFKEQLEKEQMIKNENKVNS
jgi:hypothetical protein